MICSEKREQGSLCLTKNDPLFDRQIVTAVYKLRAPRSDLVYDQYDTLLHGRQEEIPDPSQGIGNCLPFVREMVAEIMDLQKPRVFVPLGADAVQACGIRGGRETKVRDGAYRGKPHLYPATAPREHVVSVFELRRKIKYRAFQGRIPCACQLLGMLRFLRSVLFLSLQGIMWGLLNLELWRGT